MKITDIAQVSSVVAVKGTDLKIVSERRSIAPLNLIHVADADGEIVFTSDERVDVVKFLRTAR